MSALKLGILLDRRYRIVQPLSKGGFGQTYVAEDTRRPGNPKCVVKHLSPASHDSSFLHHARRLFATEAETLERLGHHDQIPRLLAYFEEEQEFYLVQDLIEGHPLTREMRIGQRWSEQQIGEMLKDVLTVLVFVHHHGVIHRDIKPDNLIRRQADGRLVLVDFGTVKQIRNPHVEPAGDSVTIAVGTPGYMPTEQTYGKPRPSSDLYALGVVGIQAATGLTSAKLREDPESGELVWRSLAPIGDDLAALLTKLVRYHFRERYQSAVEALEVVESILSHFPGPSPLPTAPPLVALGDYRHPAAPLLADERPDRSVTLQESVQEDGSGSEIAPTCPLSMPPSDWGMAETTAPKSIDAALENIQDTETVAVPTGQPINQPGRQPIASYTSSVSDGPAISPDDPTWARDLPMSLSGDDSAVTEAIAPQQLESGSSSGVPSTAIPPTIVASPLTTPIPQPAILSWVAGVFKPGGRHRYPSLGGPSLPPSGLARIMLPPVRNRALIGLGTVGALGLAVMLTDGFNVDQRPGGLADVGQTNTGQADPRLRTLPCQEAVFPTLKNQRPSLTLSESGTTSDYYGAVVDGRPADGPGTQIFANGDRYIGEFREGKCHGQGTFVKQRDDSSQSGIWHNGEWVDGNLSCNRENR